MKYLRLAAIFLAGGLLSNCAGNDKNNENYSGVLSLNLKQDSSYIVVSTLKSSYSVDDFKVEISKEGTVVKFYDKYSNVPNELELESGTYSIKAYSGEPSLAAFDAPVYVGTQNFTIKPYTKTPVDVVCYAANVKLSVSATELFKSIFSDYSLDVTPTGTTSSLAFVKDEARFGYFVAGDLSLLLHVTKAVGGKSFDLNLSSLKNLKAKDFVKITLDVDPNSLNGDVSVTIKTDETTNDKNVSIDVPGEIVPKDAPSFSILNDLPSNGIVEGTAVPFSMEVNAPNGLKDIVLEFTSPDMLALLGNTTIPLSTITPEVSAKLKSLGITWPDNFVNSKNVTISFGNLISELMGGDGVPVTHTIKVGAIDVLERKGENSSSIEIRPSIFSLGTISPGDVWTKTVYGAGTVTQGDPNKYQLEISSNNGTSWTTANFTKNISSSNVGVVINNLTPGTTYLVRPFIGKRKGPQQTITMESVKQLPNSGFENWSSSMVYEKKETWIGGAQIVEWFVNSVGESQVWGTNNPLTTSPRSGYSTHYRAYSGTIPSADKRSGNYSASITTQGWGAGSLLASSSTHDADNLTVGKLYLGAYPNEEDGINFSSRPSKLQFYYKYAPYKEDAFSVEVEVQNRYNGVTTVLGTGKINSEEGASVDSYTLGEIILSYSNSTLKATDICVVFTSSVGQTIDYRAIMGSGGVFYGNIDSRYEGSKLLIDDLSLIYDK